MTELTTGRPAGGRIDDRWAECLAVAKACNVAIFSHWIDVKLCMMVVLSELYLFMPLKVTLIVLQGNSSVKQF